MCAEISKLRKRKPLICIIESFMLCDVIFAYFEVKYLIKLNSEIEHTHFSLLYSLLRSDLYRISSNKHRSAFKFSRFYSRCGAYQREALFSNFWFQLYKGLIKSRK